MSNKRVHPAVNSIWHLSKTNPGLIAYFWKKYHFKTPPRLQQLPMNLSENNHQKPFRQIKKIRVLTFSSSTSLQTAVAIFPRLAAHTGRRLGRPPAPLLQRGHAVTKPTEGRDVLGAGAIERSWGAHPLHPGPPKPSNSKMMSNTKLHIPTYPTIRPWAYITCLRWISWIWQYCAFDCHIFWVKILSSTSNTTSHIDTHAQKKTFQIH